MTDHHYWLVVCLTFVVSVGEQPVQAVQDTRPNIVIIMTDDMGFSDIGYHGGEISTL